MPESLQESLKYLFRSIAKEIDNGNDNANSDLATMVSIIHDIQMNTAVNTGNINEAYEADARNLISTFQKALPLILEGEDLNPPNAVDIPTVIDQGDTPLFTEAAETQEEAPANNPSFNAKEAYDIILQQKKALNNLTKQLIDKLVKEGRDLSIDYYAIRERLLNRIVIIGMNLDTFNQQEAESMETAINAHMEIVERLFNELDQAHNTEEAYDNTNEEEVINKPLNTPDQNTEALSEDERDYIEGLNNLLERINHLTNELLPMLPYIDMEVQGLEKLDIYRLRGNIEMQLRCIGYSITDLLNGKEINEQFWHNTKESLLNDLIRNVNRQESRILDRLSYEPPQTLQLQENTNFSACTLTAAAIAAAIATMTYYTM